MSIPDWWEAVLLALAAWRTFQLLAEDDILNAPRRYVPERWGDFLSCPYCLGFWLALGWWAAWQIWEFGTLVAATPLALSAGVIGVHRLLSEG